MKKILLIDDDRYIFELVSGVLNNFDITYVNSIDKGIDKIDKNDYDLVILDLMLPKKSGFSLLPLLHKNNIPNILFSNILSKRISKNVLDMTTAFINKDEIHKLEDITKSMFNNIKV